MNEDIEIYYYSFITNNNLIVKLDITIFENFTYLMNIIAKEKYNYKKLKFKYVLTEFQLIFKPYIIENQLYIFEKEKLFFNKYRKYKIFN
jgi:hypothetical protein